MKKILLSFDPRWYQEILTGEKKYEYRKRFTNEECIAYIYLSSPIKQIVSKIWFGKKKLLSSYLEELEVGNVVTARVENFIKLYGDQYAIPIKKVQKIHAISLSEIRKSIPDYMPPRSYIDLEKNIDLYNIILKQENEKKCIVQEHSEIEIEYLCID